MSTSPSGSESVIGCPNPECPARILIRENMVGRPARCRRCRARFHVGKSVSVEGVESLIATEAPTSGPVGEGPPADLKPPAAVGRFQVLGRLGGGAFGVVYRAYDPELEREVAVKVPRAGTLTTARRLARFLGDAKAAARLRHPHIVPVFDVGRAGDDWFIASAFIDGRPLSEALDEGSLDLRALVDVVRRLAEALDYAHRQGVVHRDVKPDNVMLDRQDQPHLIDFGLAKLGAEEGNGRSVMGTPPYMSPEQAAGRSHEADPKSDQYSLGVTLYELLGGRTPFSGPASIVLLNVVRTEPPPLASLDPELPKDLVLICEKAMAKRPEDRYPSCGELAEDLRRWLAGEVSSVRVLSTRERFTRWVKREPRLAGAVGIATAAVVSAAVLGVLFGVSSVRYAEGEKRHREVIEGEKVRADKNALEAEKQLAMSLADHGTALCLQGEVGQGMARFAESLRKAEQPRTDGTGDVDEHLARVVRQNLAGWRDWLHALEAVVPTEFAVHALAVTPTGDRAAVGGERGGQGVVRFVHLADGRSADWEILPIERPVRAVAFAPGGSVLIVATGTRIEAWNVSNGLRVAGELSHAAAVTAVAVRRDGKAIVTGSVDGTARVWVAEQPLDTAGGLGPFQTAPALELKHSTGYEVNSVSFHPVSGHVLTGAGTGPTGARSNRFGLARVWDPTTGSVVYDIPHRLQVRSAVFHPKGDHILTGSGSRMVGEAEVWSVRGGVPSSLGVIRHQAEVWSVGYGPDGRFLLTAGQDRAVRVWDAVTLRPLGQPLYHSQDVRAVAAVVGARVVSGGDEQAVRVWAVASGPSPTDVYRSEGGPILAAVNLPASSRAGFGRATFINPTLGFVPSVDWWDWPTSTSRPSERTPPAFAARVMAVGGKGPSVRVVVADGKDEGDSGQAAVYGGGGERLGGELRHLSPVSSAGVDPEGTWVVTGCQNGRVGLWRVGNPLPTDVWGKAPAPHKEDHRVYVTEFSPSGQHILTGGKDRTACLMSVSSGTVLTRWDLPEVVLSGAFLDERRVLIGYAGGARLYEWDGTAGSEPVAVGPEFEHRSGIVRVAVGPAGTVITGGTDGRVVWWDAGMGKPLGPPWTHDGIVRAAEFDGGGRVFTAGTHIGRGTAARWRLPPPVPGTPDDVVAWVRVISGTQFKDGATTALAPDEWRKVDRQLREQSPALMALETGRKGQSRRQPDGVDPVPLSLPSRSLPVKGATPPPSGPSPPSEPTARETGPTVKGTPTPTGHGPESSRDQGRRINPWTGKPLTGEGPPPSRTDPGVGIDEKDRPLKGIWAKEIEGNELKFEFKTKSELIVTVTAGDDGLILTCKYEADKDGKLKATVTEVKEKGRLSGLLPVGYAFKCVFKIDKDTAKLSDFEADYADQSRDIIEGEYSRKWEP